MPLSSRVPDLATLDLLSSVATLGSFGRAALEHGISQPAVSSRIRHLERRLGFPLVDRSPSGSRLTPEGAIVVDWARAVLEAASVLDTGVAALRRRRQGRINVAASLTVAEYLVPSWLVGLKRRQPDLQVSLTVRNSTDVARRVLTGDAELGFIEGPDLPQGLTSRVVGHDDLVVVVAPSHPWARRRRPVGPAELCVTPLVLREAGSGTRDTLDRALGGYGGMADPLVQLSSTTAIKSAVAENVGPAVLSSLAVTHEVGEGRLVTVPVDGVALRRPLRAVWPAGHSLEPAAADLVSVALQSRRPTRRRA